MKKYLSVILTAILLLSAFCSCTNDMAKTDTIDTNDESTIELTYSEENAILLSGAKEYRIVYGDDVDKSTAMRLNNNLIVKDPDDNAKYSVYKSSEAPDDGTCEILVGLTDRALSAEAKGMLESAMDFSIIVSGNKIAIYANTPSRLIMAFKAFMNNVVLNEIDQVLYIGEDRYLERYSGYTLDNLTIDGTPISEYSIVYPHNADSSVTSIVSLYQAYFMERSGVVLNTLTDKNAESEHEILIGETVRTESKAAYTALGDVNNAYSVTVENGKLIIAANSAQAHSIAYKYFSARALKSNKAITDENITSVPLSFDQICDVTVGAVSIEQSADGIDFYRCSLAQTNAWSKLDSSLATRSKNTTGVRLDFVTDSTFIGFAVSDKSTRSSFELYLNGKREAITIPSTQYYEKQLEPTEGGNHVTIVLPTFDVGIISTVQLSSGATVTPLEYDVNILFIGDSITQGTGTDIGSLSFAQITARTLNANSVNQGIGGSYFDASTLDETLAYDPDVVVIAYGCNDWSRHRNSEDNFRAAVTTYLDKVKALYGDKTVIGISPIGRYNTPSDTKLSFDKACQIIKEEYEARGFILLDGQELIPMDRQYYNDDLHPNTKGYAVYAENLAKALTEYI